MALEGYLRIVMSSAAVYVFIILGIRLFGKRELAQLSVVDLVFILLISNAVQNAMVGPDNTLIGGLVAAATLFVLNAVLKYVLYRFPKVGELIQGEAILLVYKGKLDLKNMKKARLTVDEVNEAIREHGVPAVEDVDLAIMEVDGNISVLSDDYKRRTVKKRKAHKIVKKSG